MSPSNPAVLTSIDALLGDGQFAMAEEALSRLRRDLPVQDATVAINALLQRHADWIPALCELGQCMLQMQQHRAAFNIGSRIAQFDATDVRGIELQVIAMEYSGATPAQVLPLRRRLVLLAPDSAPNQFMLAITASRLGFYEEMHTALDAALQINPDLLLARWAKFLTPHDKFFASRDVIDRYIADWDTGCAEFAARDLEAPALRQRLEGLMLAQCNFHLAYTGIDVTSRQIALGRVLRRMAAAAFPQFDQAIRPPPLRGRKLRIGFLTATLRHHTVLKLFGGLMQRLPRDRFEVHAYALEAGSDAVTEQLHRDLDVVRTEIGALGEMAQRIRDDTCDALVYIDVGMHPRTVALSALRLAPFQAMLWGHPVTSGVGSMDAFISSALMEPADGARHYAETLMPLPGIGCWYDPAPLPLQPQQVKRVVGAPLRIVCAQNGLKLLPEQDVIFARILAAVPDAELVLLCGLQSGIEANLLRRMHPVFAAHDIDLDRRVRIIGHVDESTFLSELWQSDLVLDALSWSGGVTALETFWGDVPILTLPGEFMRSRHTAAMLTLMEIPELIANDRDDFVHRAVTLVNNADERRRIVALIAQRKHRLYRDDAVVDAFAALLEREVLQRAV
ncbi:MAG TPA: hypothetical protein PLQ74_05810 [Pseudomonadota bacterium]|nr:hypothetical protein [Rhodanobacteraceae bacterium]MBP9155056.1 hypothetical protein [Xanthomonadales bacterium]HQW81365.1 hypothetical protein [Pseudomonadota bacterium]